MAATAQWGEGGDESALERAAALLGRARLAVIGGLLTEVLFGQTVTIPNDILPQFDGP